MEMGIDYTVVPVEPNPGRGINIFNILKEAREIGTSDLHITVNTKPVTRVKGSMVRMEQYPVLTPELSRLLCEQMMNDDQKRRIEEVGEVDFSCQLEGYGRFRVNVYKQSGCYAAAIRLLAESIPSFEKLNLPQAVKKFTTLRKGLVLVTGPTGSGKSTTLAAMIDTINTYRSEHIITIEDPIEYVHNHKNCIINQREVGDDTKSFASSLRAALREDPDIILVGEMRDPETISAAITAAETGHLVFSTLHTIGASTTINRIIDSFPAGQQNQVRSQLSTVLEGVVTQRLVPKANGEGRCAALEIMFATDAIRNLIRDDKTHQITSSMQTSMSDGMQTLDKHLADLANTGVISKQTALINSIDKDNIVRFLR